MKKYLILLCVFILVCGTIAYARMNVGILGGSVPAAAGGVNVLEDFVSISDWTQAIGTWDVTGAIISVDDNSANTLITNNTVVSGTDLYIEVLNVNWAAESQYAQIVFWVQNQSNTADFIRLLFRGDFDDIYLQTARDGFADTEDIGIACTLFSPDDNDYIAVKVTGPANSATVEVWDKGAASDWSNRATWSSPDCTWSTADLDDVNGTGITRGDYVGLAFYTTPANATKADNYRFGDQ